MADPLGQSVPRLIGLSGFPSMLTICPSRTLTIWAHPTAQYGQMLGTSRAPLIFSLGTAAATGLRSSPRPARVPTVRPVPRKNCRRFVA